MLMNLDEMIAGLNPGQREAVRHAGSPLLVVAGAGSGKTKVLTTRINYLMETGVSPSDILAVTFTNKAAGEMRSRLMGLGKQLVTVGTFHSVCLNILRENALVAGLIEGFTIYDDSDQLTLIKECLKELHIDEKRLHPRRVRERISRAKDDLKGPEQLNSEASDYEDRMFIPVYEKYEKKLQFYSGVDFGDLIFKTVTLLALKKEILANYQERFRHILVDEYQDTNFAQYVFVNLLAKKYRQITVVGDPDQSIYEWRGANIENIMNFEGDYPDVKVIRLEQNYRSTNIILQASNAVIANNVYRKSKDLWSDKGEGDLIDLFKGFDDRDEAKFMVNRAMQYRMEGERLNDMVVFYRVHSQSRVLEEELRRQNIPYKIIGGVKFYARREIKDLIAYLQVIQNSIDELSLKRIINVPKRSIGLSSVNKLVKFAYDNHLTLYDGIKVYVNEPECKGRLKKSLEGFIRMIERLRQRRYEVNLVDLIEEIVVQTGYLQELEKERTIESKVRIENIKEFSEAVYEFEQTLTPEEKNDALRHYLEYISLQTSIDNQDQSEEVLTLMTLHSAKGLEFPIVFMMGFEEELLPHANSIGHSAREIEEERRLCYVGMTRAQEKLIISHATMRRMHGSTRAADPSRFLDEIPSQFINKVYKDSPKSNDGYSLDFDPFDDDDEDVIYY